MSITKHVPARPAALKPVKATLKPAKATLKPAKATLKPVKDEKRGRRGYAGRTYKVLTGENVSREGTFTHALIQALLDNDSVDAANAQLAAGGYKKPVDIGWAAKKGLISLDAE